MIILNFIVALLFLLNPGFSQDTFAKLEIYAKALEDAENFTGVVLVCIDDEIFTYAMGYSNFEEKVKNSPETWFRYASITKPFTAVLIYRLEQRGFLRVEDSLSNYIHDYPFGDQITLAHLLAHRSGIPNYTSFEDFYATMHLATTNADIISSFKELELEFEPGSTYAYSNSGYTLLSHIVEEVTGLSYSDALTTFVLEPAGITQVSYEDPEVDFPLLANGYSSSHQVQLAQKIHMSIPQGAGGLIGDAMSLIKLIDSVFDDEFISESSRKHMFYPISSNYGHGWSLGPLLDYPAVGHAGGINGFSTNFMHIPLKDLSIVVLSNAESIPVGNITRDLASIVLGRNYSLPQKKTSIEIGEDILANYEGLYELMPGFILAITTQGNRIYAQATNQPQFEIYPSSETEFYLTVVEARIVFDLDSQGSVSGLTLFQGGQMIYGKRIN